MRKRERERWGRDRVMRGGGEGGGGRGEGNYDESDILTTPGVQHEMFEVRH
jgi:hypothetical protein